MSIAAADVVRFWREAGAERWFDKDAAFDEAIRARFEPLHHAAARGELDDWGGDAEGALALALLFDQFPRNLYRNSAHAFATDPLARKAAAQAIERGFDAQIPPDLRSFFYMPFTHSENLAEQDRAVALHQALARETGDGDSARWAVIHRNIITRFGRFPHRNRALGRTTTPEEQAFLDAGGFAG